VCPTVGAATILVPRPKPHRRAPANRSSKAARTDSDQRAPLRGKFAAGLRRRRPSLPAVSRSRSRHQRGSSAARHALSESRAAVLANAGGNRGHGAARRHHHGDLDDQTSRNVVSINVGTGIDRPAHDYAVDGKQYTRSATASPQNQVWQARQRARDEGAWREKPSLFCVRACDANGGVARPGICNREGTTSWRKKGLIVLQHDALVLLSAPRPAVAIGRQGQSRRKRRVCGAVQMSGVNPAVTPRCAAIPRRRQTIRVRQIQGGHWQSARQPAPRGY